jgi:DNA-binding response OmpR family regulator
MADTPYSEQKCVMVVDQNAPAISGLLQALTQSEYRVAGPFRECADAFDWLTGETPDGALLNILLTDNGCFELAKQLRLRGVPYLFHSGGERDRGDGGDGPARTGPNARTLLDALSNLMA